jgi:phage terminase large subunit
VTDDLVIDTAEVFLPLLERDARDLGAHGGRGSGKSHFFGENLVDRALAQPGECGGEGLRWVCIREVQRDLAESSKALIEAKLRKFGLGERQGFRVFKEAIQLPGDGLVIFRGMNEYNAESIKSLEGFDGAWWEEAQSAASHSIKLLRPTLRKRGSQMWWSWNPRLKTDPVDVMLRGAEIPTGAIVVKANWRDNPWITRELLQERLDCKRMQPDQYEHIWEGGYVTMVDGAYFATQLSVARKEGRVSTPDVRVNVTPDPLLTRRIFVDIGGTGAKADNFVMWPAQFVGREVRLLDHYERQGQPASAHLTWLRERGYTPGTTSIWLPHDGEQQDKVYDASYEKYFTEAGYDVTVIPNQGKGAANARIEAARRVFPMCWFDTKCEPGVAALGWYHEKRDPARNVGLGPEHDWSSHSADAFGLMAIAYEMPVPDSQQPKPPPRNTRWIR